MKTVEDKKMMASLTNTPIFLFGLLIAAYTGTHFDVFPSMTRKVGDPTALLAVGVFHAFVVAILGIFIVSMLIWSYIVSYRERPALSITQRVITLCVDWAFGSALLFASFVAGGSVASLATISTHLR